MRSSSLPRRWWRCSARAWPTPASRLALVRSWQTSTLLVKNGAFSGADIVAIKAFCAERSFDVAFYPGMQAAGSEPLQRGRAHPTCSTVQRHCWVRGGTNSCSSYKFHVAPATDDKPHFFHFFKWRSLPELLSLKEQGGLPLLEWGYPVLVATLAQAVLGEPAVDRCACSLGHAGSAPGSATALPPAGSRGRVLVYFTAIGFAFMFIEIAFIQKFVLFLSHPLYAVAVVLFAFLLFAGIGSARLQALGTTAAAPMLRTRWRRSC